MRIEAAIAARRDFMLGEIEVRFDGAGAVVSGPRGDEAGVADVAPDALREWVRQDHRGRYRPLPGARTMRRGWQVRCRDDGELLAALDAIYPLARQHIEQHERGELRVVPLDEVLGRQTGRYAVAAQLGPQGREAAARVLCGLCVKTPVWRSGSVTEWAIPCPEPCSVLVALCREAALWEKAPPDSAPMDGSLPFARFELPGNQVRESYLAARFGAGSGETAH